VCVHICVYAYVCVYAGVYVPHASRVLAEVGSRGAQDNNLNHFDLRKSYGRCLQLYAFARRFDERREILEGREGL
jgi:hypothetical protein